MIAERSCRGGRLIYAGAGTSGRLGVLDASECPPTFSTPPEMVVGLIAGGREVLTGPSKVQKTIRRQHRQNLKELLRNESRYDHGDRHQWSHSVRSWCAEYARSIGAFTIGLACNERSALASVADLMITPIVGPEVITGSTRLKAGTATKLILNMLTTGAMIRIGKTYGNLMVDLCATNQKLCDRSQRIVSEVTNLPQPEAAQLLSQCGGEVKTAIVTALKGVSPDEARRLLTLGAGHLRSTLSRIP